MKNYRTGKVRHNVSATPNYAIEGK